MGVKIGRIERVSVPSHQMGLRDGYWIVGSILSVKEDKAGAWSGGGNNLEADVFSLRVLPLAQRAMTGPQNIGTK